MDTSKVHCRTRWLPQLPTFAAICRVPKPSTAAAKPPVQGIVYRKSPDVGGYTYRYAFLRSRWPHQQTQHKQNDPTHLLK
jgi:hypothetical protein